ncbi:hypothetical protein GP486_008098, partial [Trichoglossum hirsutum]
IKKITFEQSYDPNVSHELKDEYFIDACTGQPKTITEEAITEILKKIKESCEGRELTATELGYSVGISERSALQVLHANQLRKWKPI